MRQLREPDRIRRKKEEFVQQNMGLVASVARKYKRRTFSFDDALQEGCIGMLKALDKFDTESGVRFSTYAYYWIRQSCARAAQDQSALIRLPNYLYTTRDSSKQAHLEACRYVGSIDHGLCLKVTPSMSTNKPTDDTQALLEELLADTLTESECHLIQLHFFGHSPKKDRSTYNSIQKTLRKLRVAAQQTKYQILREQLRE